MEILFENKKLAELKIQKAQYMKYMMATNFTGTVTTDNDDITLELWNTTLKNGFISVSFTDLMSKQTKHYRNKEMIDQILSKFQETRFWNAIAKYVDINYQCFLLVWLL